MSLLAAARETGLAAIAQVQGLAPGLDLPMQAVSALGRTEAYLLILPFVLWCVDRRLALTAILLLIANDAAGSLLKLIFHEPRPYWTGAVTALSAEPSYGIPSAHASSSLVVWGCLALHARRPAVTAAAAALVLAMGFSRCYLGVHFPHDVLAGWLLGSLVLVLGLRGRPALAAHWRAMDPGHALALAAALSVAIPLAGMATVAALVGTPDDPAWREQALRARSLAPFFTAGGALLGLLAAATWMERRHPHGPARLWSQRAAAFALGAGGTLLLYVGLGWLFGRLAEPESAAGLALRFVRYAAVAVWIAGVAPQVMMRLGLVRAEGVGAER